LALNTKPKELKNAALQHFLSLLDRKLLKNKVHDMYLVFWLTSNDDRV